MLKFGLICEGATDHAVIKNILFGYCADPDLIILPLQPDTDATQENVSNTFGGWYKVFDYCRSERFFRAFDDADMFLVVQIDTDCAHEKNYDVKTTDSEGHKLSIEQIAQNVQQKFESLFVENFGSDFLNANSSRILYAIAIDEIECWLLPLYYDDKTKGITHNCFYKLNEQRRKKGEKAIRLDKTGEVPTYQNISKPYIKNKILMDKYALNPSFKIFIDRELKIKIPI